MRKLPLLAALLLLSVTPLRAADDPDPNAGVSGEHDFNMYCSSCHGESGKGDGRIAARLEKKPPDLTQLTRRYGAFPRDKVIQFIDGQADVAAHGNRDMPVWGKWFTLEATEGLGGAEGDAATVKRRIDNVVDYIETLQVK
ncbi:MAG: c-type cytochrome [Hyphomicrobiales bacterium]